VGIEVLMLRVTSEDESLLQASMFREAVIIADGPAISIDLFGFHSYETVSRIPGHSQSALTDFSGKGLNCGISAHNVLAESKLLGRNLRF
jgi:hypothetical protein